MLEREETKTTASDKLSNFNKLTLIRGLAFSAIDFRSSMPLLRAIDVRADGAGAKAAAEPKRAAMVASFIMVENCDVIVGLCDGDAALLCSYPSNISVRNFLVVMRIAKNDFRGDPGYLTQANTNVCELLKQIF